MKNSVIAIPSQYVVITTIIVYALLAPIFFEMDNAFGGETYLLWMIKITKAIKR
jgi:hypothetical protein